MKVFDVVSAGMPVVVPLVGSYPRKGFRCIPVLPAGATAADAQAAYATLSVTVTRMSESLAAAGIAQAAETYNVPGPDWNRSPGFGAISIAVGFVGTVRVWIADDCYEIQDVTPPYMAGFTPGATPAGGTLTTSNENQNLTAAAPTAAGDGVSIVGKRALRVHYKAANAGATMNAAGNFDGYYRSNNNGNWVRCPTLDIAPSVAVVEPMGFGETAVELPIGADRVQWVANGATVSAGTQVIRTIETLLALFALWVCFASSAAHAQPAPINHCKPGDTCRVGKVVVSSPAAGAITLTNSANTATLCLNAGCTARVYTDTANIASLYGGGFNLKVDGTTGQVTGPTFNATSAAVNPSGLSVPNAGYLTWGGNAAVDSWISGVDTILSFGLAAGAETDLTATSFSPRANGGNSLGETALRWQNLWTVSAWRNTGESVDVSAAIAEPSQEYDTTLSRWRMCNSGGCAPNGAQQHPALERRTAWSFWPNESTTIQTVGATAPTVTDAAAATTNTNDATRYFRNFVTTAAAGGTSSIRWGDSVRVQHQPGLTVNVRTDQSAVTSTRIWIGISDRTVAQMNADDPASGNLCAFRYSTDAGDTNWMLCTKDGTTLSCVSTGVAVAAATSYVMRLEVESATGCYGFISSGVGSTYPLYRQRRLTNLPGTAANMLPLAMIEARAASARALGLNNFTPEGR